MAAAPWFADIADGPEDVAATWLDTSDGLRVRVAVWTTDAPRGTVLLFPGRSEYVEKYGPAAGDLAARGYATVAIDWRGQGLAGRMLPDRTVGHVAKFADYQRDVAAMVAHAQALGLPRPWHLLAHSMGGCIGLRSLVRGLDVASCAFTAPMWGIQMAPALRPVAWTLSSLSRPLRFGHVFAPGQVSESYVLRSPFEGNTLTGDPQMYAWLQSHLHAHPDLALGGATLHWLNESLTEMRALAALPSPELPCLTWLGSTETIVDPRRIRDRMARWPDGELIEIDGSRHEVLMEGPAIRARVYDGIAAHFDAAALQAA